MRMFFTSYSYNAIKLFCERVGGVRKRFSNFHSISDENQFCFRLMLFFLILLMLLKYNKMQCIDMYFITFGRLMYGDQVLNKITAHLPLSLF